MNKNTSYTPVINKAFDADCLLNGIYIVVLHATRIPPHIGLIINKHYHSLTIKGQDCNIPVDVLLKTINQRKIPSLFINLKPHFVYSHFYMAEHFITNIKKFPRVDVGVATCLTPLKLFFEEVYDIQMENINFLYELLPTLHSHNLVGATSSLFVNEVTYTLPYYTFTEINTEIKEVRDNF